MQRLAIPGRRKRLSDGATKCWQRVHCLGRMRHWRIRAVRDDDVRRRLRDAVAHDDKVRQHRRWRTCDPANIENDNSLYTHCRGIQIGRALLNVS